MSESAIYQELVEFLTIKIQPPINAGKIFFIVGEGLKFLSQLKTMNDDEKKELILHAAKEAIQNSFKINNDDKTQYIALIDIFGSTLTDQLLELGKDMFSLVQKGYNKTKNWFKVKGCCQEHEKDTSSHQRAVNHKLGLVNDELEEMTAYFKLKIQKPFTANKILSLLAYGIRQAELLKGISGSERKDLVIRALHHAVDGSDHIDENEKKSVHDLIDSFADDVIDMMVDFGRDVYRFARKKCSFGLCNKN
jgi:hypothetical protein